MYDLENFTFSQSINEVQRHDFEIEERTDQQVTTSVDFAYSFNSKPLEPFSKVAFMKKVIIGNYFRTLILIFYQLVFLLILILSGSTIANSLDK